MRNKGKIKSEKEKQNKIIISKAIFANHIADQDEELIKPDRFF
jgi:hypothetical protein